MRSKLEIPENKHGLKVGSKLKAIDIQAEIQLGIAVGTVFSITYFFGAIIYKNFTWEVDQLCDEIDSGIWEITEEDVTKVPS